MGKKLRFLGLLLTVVCFASSVKAEVVMTEDFEGSTNIFGVTQTTLEVGKASIYASGLQGFDNVLAVCKATVAGTISATGIQTGDDGTVTAEWDAFHGWYGNNNSITKISLLNSDGEQIAAYEYNANNCQVQNFSIGGSLVSYDAFALQSKYTATSNSNGWAGGSKGQKYVATSGWNPHIAVTLTAKGSVTMAFTVNGATTKVYGSVGTVAKNIAKIEINSTVDNTDRCYGIDNISVSTGKLNIDPNYIEKIANVTIEGAQTLSFGENTSTAFSNPYKVIIVGTDGTTISEDNINEKVTNFNVEWNIEGFKTINDNDGQYCDSYGSFSVNNTGKVSTTFDLRDVAMNFYGKLTATITYNDTTVTASKYVIALGNLSRANGQILPLAGYPIDFSTYPVALADYSISKSTYGDSQDFMLGGWCVSGSDTHTAVLKKDNDGTMFVRINAITQKKSHVLSKTIDAPTAQIIFRSKVRFNNAGGTMTLTSKYPFWSSTSGYSNPVTLSYDGVNISLNGSKLTKDDNVVNFSTGNWYDVVLSIDKTTESCYALVYDTNGNKLAESELIAWTETSNPTFFSIGIDNSNTGSIDMASFEAYQPVANNFTLAADKTTLSIPNGDTATLTATLTDQNGYDITQSATWSIVESDMQENITITPSATNSHEAVITPAATAEAGTATVLVNIGGNTKTQQLTLTSSAESIRFTSSTTSITIPLDADASEEVSFAAITIDGNGNDLDRKVTLKAYEKDGTTTFSNTDAISFDEQTGKLTVTAAADNAQIIIRGTSTNSNNETLTKDIRVNIHGMKFDFGYNTDEDIAEGYTAVGTNDIYSATNGYGIVTGTPTAAGTASNENPMNDYLEGDMQFNFKVQKGAFYTVSITYQGKLTTGYINSDLAGYALGTHTALETMEYTIPATRDIIDLHFAADATTVARVAQISVTKQPARQKRAKRVVRHIGDSTSANNGSWAYTLSHNYTTAYPELDDLCVFINNGRGSRNLSSYYTEGLLANVLNEICPGDIIMLGNMGTNGMGNSFEDDFNYYLDAAEVLGAQVIINSYTPHGAVSGYAGGYNSATNTFDSYRRDSYDVIARKIAAQRDGNDDNYLGFVEIGKNADAIFNAYVNDYATNDFASKDAAAQAIIACFPDHNHYSNASLACELMLNGYKNTDAKGIVAQLIELLGGNSHTEVSNAKAEETQEIKGIYDFLGRKIPVVSRLKKGFYIINGKKMVVE